ncbi:MAG: NAD(P)-dependent oxidoreductase [Gemmatimonadales bacterium]
MTGDPPLHARPRVAFLGLGAIGRPMAARVARLYPLTVWNRTAEVARRFAEGTNAAVAATPREAARAAEVLITCLPTSAEVEALLDGPEGILAGLAPGGLLVDCTSGSPEASRRIAERLQAEGHAFVDAPVSGGTHGAEAGTLTVMLGGAEPDVLRATEVVRAFGQRIEHLGPVGAGHAMKAVNNALLAVNMLALGESLAALARAGVAPRMAVDVLNVSSGRSFVSQSLVPERILTGTFPHTFRLALLHKDVGIAADLAASGGVEHPMLAEAVELLGRARDALGEQADYLETFRVNERQAGVELRG